MIAAKINVVKIDKSKLFPGKNGAKYLDILLIESTDDQYGNDYMVVQGVSKEERAAGVKGAILGNAKILGQKPTTTARNTPPPEPTTPPDDDDVPF